MTASPTDASSRDLAAALAERLNAIVPAGFEIRADGTDINVYFGGRLVGGSTVTIPVAVALSGLQDDIIETRALAADPPAEVISWPEGASASGLDLPQPGCRYTGDELLVWFGDEDSPVVALPPIPLTGM